MRSRELLLVIALAACTKNLDPRQPTLAKMEREGYGGWIVAVTREGWGVQGELISATPQYVHILRSGTPGQQLVYLETRQITEAKVYTYVSEGGVGIWAVLGTLTTVSHGFFLVLSAPVWMISGGIAAESEAGHIELEYPDESLEELAKWARFPQGIPPGVDERALFFQRSQLPPPVPAAPPPPGPIAPPSATTPVEPKLGVATLYEEAKAAATANDCAKVLELSGRVQLADPTYWDAVFAKQPDIRRCIGL